MSYCTTLAGINDACCHAKSNTEICGPLNNNEQFNKFLDSSIGAFLEQVSDDISVTKFLSKDDKEAGMNDVSVTKFLD